jgi:F-type H+-transporting ATPase subunit epsilon
MAEQKKLSGSGSLSVRIVTPKGIIADTKTDGVTAPGRLGEFEVLPGHVPLLAELHPGVLTLGEKNQEKLAVAAGYLKVGVAGDIEVLVERAVRGEDVDLDTAKAELAEVKPKVDGWKDELNAEFRTLSDRSRWAQAQIDARGRSGN